jgi:hypothetical protein
MRKTSEELQAIMNQENCDRIWSWSRINCFHTSPFEYMLKYVKCIPEDRQDCIYTTTGTIAHDILEKFYTNQIKYEDMIDNFEDAWLIAHDVGQLKFDRNDEEKNKKIGEKYYSNLQHFFNNHTVLKNKPIIEQFVKFKIGDNLFTGYIDCCFKDDDGNYNIIDFKTSSIYKGDKAENECGQLVCYAVSLSQMGIPFDKIRIAWNFLKYVSIQYEQKNGAVKTREVDRSKIGESLQSNAKTWLKAFGYEPDEYLKLLLDTNSIKVLPEEVQQKYVISDCYIYVPLTQKLIDKWVDTIIATIADIKLREADYKETGSEMCFWDTDESVEKNSFYFATLSGYSGNLHKPYGKYLERLEARKNGDDLFDGVGSSFDENIATTDKIIRNKPNENGEVDLSWLDAL